MSLADKKFVVLPGLGYSPETKLIFGVGSLYKLDVPWKDSADRDGVLNFNASYSLNKQFTSELGYWIASKKEKYVSYGEVGYNKFPLKYYGHGNEVNYDTSELFTPRYIRFRFTGLAKVNSWLAVGPRFQFDNVKDLTVKDNGILAMDNVLGKEGGKVSGAGYVLNSDKRDANFIPSKGHYLEFRHVFFRDVFGSDFSYDMYQYDLRKYVKISKKHVLALQHYGHYTSGDVPFFEMARFGGTYRMRGHYQGTYRDKNATLFQVDYRHKLSKRFVWSAFGGMGWVNENIKDFRFEDNRISVGTGIRLYSQISKLAFRFDFAFARDNSGFYIGMGEAF
jgi:hypothetical protein